MMPQDTTGCPNNQGGDHRYFVFKTYDAYEPVALDGAAQGFYQRKEYAVLGCNCSSVIKREVLA